MRTRVLLMRGLLLVLMAFAYWTKPVDVSGDGEGPEGDYLAVLVRDGQGDFLHARGHASLQVYYAPDAAPSAPRRFEVVREEWFGGESVVATMGWSGSSFQPHAIEVPRAFPGFEREYVVRVVGPDGEVDAQARVRVAADFLAWLGTFLALATAVLLGIWALDRRERAEAAARDAARGP